MSEKRFTLDDEENGLCRCILVDGEEMPTCEICGLLNEQQATIKQLKSDKAIAEDYANIFEMENVKLRKKLNNYKATVLGFYLDDGTEWKDKW